MAESHKTHAGTLQCIVVTPETTVLDTPADFVALPLFDGEAGVAPGRAPLIGRLGYGELRVRSGSDTRRFYVDGGFVQVVDNVVSVLSNRAIPAEKVDPTAAADQLRTALERPAAGTEELAIRERQVSQARGQLRVASHVGQLRAEWQQYTTVTGGIRALSLGAGECDYHNGGTLRPLSSYRITMTRLQKAAAWTVAAAAPLLLAYLLPRGIAAPVVALYLAAFFALSWMLVFPDESSVRMLRDAELDALFDNVFSDYEADLSRFPFRAHIFRRRGMYPVEKLEMIYSYRTHATDPDRDIRFYRYFGQTGEGLVWQTCENGDVRYFRRDDVPDAKAAFHLRGSQDSATREVFAILTLPLRQLVGNPQASGKNGPIGVLSFDALSTEAADSLQELFNQFLEGEHTEVAELADRTSLYI